MSKSKDIREKCLDCAGGSPKEVTLCHVIACTLWPHRFGCSYKSKRFKERTVSAMQRYPGEYAGIVEALQDHIKTHPNSPEYVAIHDILAGNPS